MVLCLLLEGVDTESWEAREGRLKSFRVSDSVCRPLAHISASGSGVISFFGIYPRATSKIIY